MSKRLSISICSFKDGTFDAMFKDPDTGRELILSGEQSLDDEDLEFALEIAPACVWTEYKRTTPED